MLVTRRGGRLTLVRQPAHGRVAGQLAGHWGNQRFVAPAAREALVAAATHHDDGWVELDDTRLRPGRPPARALRPSCP